MAASSHGRGARPHLTRHVPFWPATQLGWGAVALAAASVVLIPSWKLMGQAGAVPGLSCGFAGGIVALAAMLRQKERAVTVVASLVPFLFAVVFVIAELTVGHS